MRSGAKDGRNFWLGILLLAMASALIVSGLINQFQNAPFWTNASWAVIAGGAIAAVLWRRYSIPKERTAPKRPHPYADEVSPPEEEQMDGRRITLIWFLGSSFLAALGLWINFNYSPHSLGYNPESAPHLFAPWNNMNVGILGMGLVLLGLKAWAPERWTWTRWLGLPGWVLFGLYWAITARDLFIAEDSDYVNSIAAVLAVYMFNYFAYHEWLNNLRQVPNVAIQWMRKTVVIAAGTYFAIAYIDPVRVGLIKMVGNHTNAMLNVFGLGSKKGLEFTIDEVNILGPVRFEYGDTIGKCPDGTVPEPSRFIPDGDPAACLDHSGSTGWFDDLLFYLPDLETIDPAHGLKIVSVSIILACTAIQTIMLFAGMFIATPDATWKKRIQHSLGVGAVIYTLNLMRNSMVIWAYGRGHTSFWVIHNFIAKLVTLTALVGIAWVTFRTFPEWFRALGAALDLPQRDGPIERTLHLGRRRPDGPAPETIDVIE